MSEINWQRFANDRGVIDGSSVSKATTAIFEDDSFTFEMGEKVKARQGEKVLDIGGSGGSSSGGSGGSSSGGSGGSSSGGSGGSPGPRNEPDPQPGSSPDRPNRETGTGEAPSVNPRPDNSDAPPVPDNGRPAPDGPMTAVPWSSSGSSGNSGSAMLGGINPSTALIGLTAIAAALILSKD